MTTEIISTILQLLVFTFIPFLVFVIKYKGIKKFFKYIGLYRPPPKAVYLALIVSLIFVANGSIIPGWIAHGLGNMISYTSIGFF